MTKARVTIHYDKKKDKDIHDWIESLPERGKTPFLQKAIRSYIQKENTLSGETENINIILEKTKELEQRIETLEGTEGTTRATDNDEKYVDASELLKNLGK